MISLLRLILSPDWRVGIGQEGAAPDFRGRLQQLQRLCQLLPRLVLCSSLVLTLALSLGGTVGGQAANAAVLLDSQPVASLSLPLSFRALTAASLEGVAGGSAFHFAGKRPSNLGASKGSLAACPSTPNCVSSQAMDEVHQIEAIDYAASGLSTRQVMQALKQIVDDSERAEVLRTEEGYLYAEFTSRLMGFVDDVEFLCDAEHQRIEVRSASRLGESDLGINRRRIESIRTQLQSLLDDTETST